NLSQYPQALEFYQQALEISKAIGDKAGEAVTLNNIGVVYDNLSQYRQALKFHQQALEIHKAIGNQAGEAAALNNIGGVYDNLSQYPQALESYQQALEISKAIGKRAGAATTLSNIGQTYTHLSQYAKALEFYQQALEIKKAIGNKDGEASSLNNIGLIHHKLADYLKALELHQQALKIAKAVGNRNLESTTLNNIGVVYSDLGKSSQALKFHHQALEIRKAIGNRDGEMASIHNMGSVYNQLGEYLRALESYKQALEIAKAIGNRAGEGTIFNSIGGVYDNVGEYSQALKFHQQALAIYKEIGSRHGEATSLNGIGGIYYQQKKYTEARQSIEQALAIVKDIGAQSDEGSTLNNLGVVYASLGEDSRALDFYQQALKIHKKIGKQDSAGTALMNIGDFYLNQQEYSQAIEFSQQALKIFQAIGKRDSEGNTLSILGRTFLKSGNLAEAEKTLLAAMAIRESLRAGLQDNDAFKISIFESQANTYRLLQRVYIAQNQPEAALEISERGRARAFIELLASQLSTDETNQPTIAQPTIEQIKRIAKEQNATIVEYSITYNDVRTKGKYLESKLFIWVIKPTGEIKFRSVDLISQGTILADLVPKMRESLGINSRGAIQHLAYTPGDLVRLKDDEESGLKEPWQVIGVDSERAMLILTHPQFDDGVQISRPISDAIAKVESSRTNQQQLQNLHQLLIAPIAELLPTNPNDRVIFIPQRELFLIPFPALQDSDGKYLIEKHTMLIAPSIQVLELTHRKRNKLRGKKLGSALVVGNPTMPTIPLTKPPQRLSSLPGAEAEAKAIAELLNTQPFLGKQATKVNIVPRMQQAGLIHLATHGLLDDFKQLGVPGAIALAPSGSDNGFLTSGDILGLKLNAELVVLSACNTGQGRITGDGVIGLSRSLMAAGVKSAIVSLWSVPDAPTAELMKEFYQNYLQQGMNKVQALRQAMLKAKDKHPNPKDWAAFTLIGEAE
ncbi:hypothetical protein CBP30_06390, partial [Fischerella thermalis WC157]